MVRRAYAGETADHSRRRRAHLAATDLVVADDAGAISLAGVMGGESTEIGPDTSDVLLEAAHWTPPVISRTARQRGLTSEASRRFERAVDPAIAASAAERAAELLVEHGGGRIEPGRTDVGYPVPLATVTLPMTEPDRLIGHRLAPGAAARRLVQVGCAVVAETAETRAGGHGVLQVTPPSWRPDLTRPADLVEEITRLEGYDRSAPRCRVPRPAPGSPPGNSPAERSPSTWRRPG